MKQASLLGKKWTIPLVDALFYSEGLSFNQLVKRIDGLKPKVLVQCLKEMESAGWVQNLQSVGEKKKLSWYTLTKRGKELHRVVKVMKKWCQQNGLIEANCVQSDCSRCSAGLAQTVMMRTLTDKYT